MEESKEHEAALKQEKDSLDTKHSPVLDALEKHLEKWYGEERRSPGEVNQIMRHTIGLVDKGFAGLSLVPAN